MANIPAHRRLAAWLELNEKKQRDVARSLRVSEGQMSLLVSGQRRPSLVLATRIEKLTGIPASAWVVQKDGAVA